MIRGGGIIGWLVRKAVEAISDRLFKSPLDRDFGEATPDDIIPPSSRYVATLLLEDLEKPLARMVEMIDGLTVEQVSKVSLRLYEMRIGRTANFQFQVKDTGTPVELQLILEKHANREVEIDFRSSEAIIRLVQLAMEGE